jgi:hypothetical protein
MPLVDMTPAESQVIRTTGSRNEIVSGLTHQRNAAAQVGSRFDAARAARLIERIQNGAELVIFGGVSYQVEDGRH